MGNRAVIAFKDDDSIGLYLHWNGGRDSVEPFLMAAKELGLRCQDDPGYAIARLAQLIGNWMGSTTSIGVGPLSSLDCDNMDNGVYRIKDWEIVRREHHEGPEQTGYEPEKMTKEVLEANASIKWKGR